MTFEMSGLRRYPRLISLEGGEGAGKTTVLNALRDALCAQGGEVVLTREPGGTALAESIRDLLLAKDHEAPCPETELLLMFAARVQHVRQLVLPALERGAWVVSDRFTDSSYAYQGGGRGLQDGLIQMLERDLVGIVPAMTLLLDLPVAQGRERMRGRALALGTHGPDRIESEQDAFFERVRAAYRARAQADPTRFRVIDATQSVDVVAREAVAHLHQLQQAPAA